VIEEPGTLHVAHVSFFTDPQARAPQQLLHDWPTLVDVAEAASSAGVRVSVLQACPHPQQLTRNGVSYHFLPLGRGAASKHWAGGLAELLRGLAPELLHVQGLSFAHDVLTLDTLAPGVPMLLQDHADRPPRLWRRPGCRRGLAVASGIAFCSLAQARPFANAGLIHPQTRVYEIPESTSRFTPGDREHARRRLSVAGDPLLLWVGHLDANKDPLTVLDAISLASHEFPNLQLYCCYGKAPLLRMVQHRINADERLQNRVHLVGQVAHSQIEQLMRAADAFVLGSHREGSGYSVVEALACGLPPLVTDIPSFRSLTGDGAVGALWPIGHARQLRDSLVSLLARPQLPVRAQVRAHFDAELCFDALGRKLAAAYQDVLRRARGRAYARCAGIRVRHG
jgi:glycosyltransferase involved in cell wall biosynthesis